MVFYDAWEHHFVDHEAKVDLVGKTELQKSSDGNLKNVIHKEFGGRMHNSNH